MHIYSISYTVGLFSKCVYCFPTSLMFNWFALKTIAVGKNSQSDQMTDTQSVKVSRNLKGKPRKSNHAHYLFLKAVELKEMTEQKEILFPEKKCVTFNSFRHRWIKINVPLDTEHSLLALLLSPDTWMALPQWADHLFVTAKYRIWQAF